MYLNQYWRDERLAFHAFAPFGDTGKNDVSDVLTLSGDFAEKIWVPDTFFANDKNRQVFAMQSIFQLEEITGLISTTKGCYGSKSFLRRV